MSSEASQLTEIIRHGQVIWRWKQFLWGKHCLLYRKVFNHLSWQPKMNQIYLEKLYLLVT